MGLTDTCSQCTMGVTDTHALWECSLVQAFWNTVTQELTDILSCRIPLSPSICFLGYITPDNTPRRYRNSLLTSLTINKKIILQNRKSRHTLHINHWPLATLTQHIYQCPKLQPSIIMTYRPCWKPGNLSLIILTFTF